MLTATLKLSDIVIVNTEEDWIDVLPLLHQDLHNLKVTIHFVFVQLSVDSLGVALKVDTRFLTD